MTIIRVIFQRLQLRLARRRQKIHLLNQLLYPTYISKSSSFSFHSRISIGRYCRIGANCYLDGEGGLTIKDGTILASRVAILTGSHNYNQVDLLPYDEKDDLQAVEVGSGVWFGFGVTVIPGVSIGDAAVIAAGSVVTKSVAAGEIVGGNPAKTISKREMDEKAIALLISKERYFLKEFWSGNITRNSRNTQAPEIVTHSGE